MPRSACPINCTCGLHHSTSSRFAGKTHSKTARAAQSKANLGRVRPVEEVEAVRAGVQAWHDSLSVEQRLARGLAISRGNPRSSTSGRLGWTGGLVGELFAQVLCPVGYVREHQVNYAPGGASHYKLDFAHLQAMVNIELDGPWHLNSTREDAVRDGRLRALGWKVIRIKHGSSL